MTTMTHETEITADDKIPVIRITREFDAPQAKVFRAHTDPELLARWLGPRDLEMTIDYFDANTLKFEKRVELPGDFTTDLFIFPK